jgi:S-adenosylmethionine hydrolase
MSRAIQPTRRKLSFPVVTITTDFGELDHYVAAMKIVLLQHCPTARLIDVTHFTPPQDVLRGSITLERAIAAAAPGTIHLAVVDPGVGSERKLIVAEIDGQFVVGPDNGLVTWAWRMHGGGRAFEITWRPKEAASNVFHGRDIFAPVAGMLASGKPLKALARPLKGDPILLDLAPVSKGKTKGKVIFIDHFGNATTNLPCALVPKDRIICVHVKNRLIGPLRKCYSDVIHGEPLVLIGSSDLLEIAIRDGSAAKLLHINVGDEVEIV